MDRVPRETDARARSLWSQRHAKGSDRGSGFQGVRADGKLLVEIVAPSHYDDDGYLIQWFRALVPANPLACVYGLARDVADRRALGKSVDVLVNAYDERLTVVPVRRIIRRLRRNGNRGVVLLVGLQTNQIPRATDLAREFRSAGVQVAIGGSHVSGCLAMLPELPADLRGLQAMGVTLFAGEAEGRMQTLLEDTYHQRMQPIYNYLNDLPDLAGHPIPRLPRKICKKNLFFGSFDAGRGCPFDCSFCTIINVQGRRPRSRTADDVERAMREGLALGIRHFFISDDNFSRNPAWESILDRIIAIRERERVPFKLFLQLDAMSHRVPGLIEKAARAGCNRVFIGLESIDPENLEAVKKHHNRVSEYREMLQAWRSHGVTTFCGYLVGLPGDTPESVARDVATIQRELPVDILQPFILTPLPGSALHRDLQQAGTWMDPDLNRYDDEHVITEHPRMSASQWREAYQRAWHGYYTLEHIETLLRRAKCDGPGTRHMADAIQAFYGSFRFEGLHPYQVGIFRRKVRTSRRPGLPVENPIVFHVRETWRALRKYTGFALFCLQVQRIRRRVERQDPKE